MTDPSNASQQQDLDPRYIAARRVLLDALTVLEPHGDAVILAGAQAVYLHTGAADLAIAPYTTDGDLVLDPLLLGDAPELEAGMTAAGFHLQPQPGGHVEPGIWLAMAFAAGEEFLVPVDLIVPEGAASGTGRRAARLGGHGARAARRAVGLEAALVDNSTMTIAALDPADERSLQARVAGPAALLVAKAHKLHDRVASGCAARLDRKALEILADELSVDQLDELRLLSGPANLSAKTKKAFERFSTELEKRGVVCQWRVLPADEARALHARVISDDHQTFEVPPLNSVLAGTVDSIRASEMPMGTFEDAWVGESLPSGRVRAGYVGGGIRARPLASRSRLGSPSTWRSGHSARPALA
jgi:hypothetical protein